jgi:hypothetical protein
MLCALRAQPAVHAPDRADGWDSGVNSNELLIGTDNIDRLDICGDDATSGGA